MKFNRGQEMVIQDGVDWYNNSSEQVFEFAGKAGTGKSVVLNEIIRRLKIPRHRIAPMAYIGQAAIVMRTKGLLNASTMHSWLYYPDLAAKYDNNNVMIMDTYYDRPEMELVFTPKELIGIDLILIDEAYTMPYKYKADIESRGIKIIACGDAGQLPPVGDRPAYLYGNNVRMLTEVMRQNQYSAILYLADRASRGLPIHKGWYGNCLVIEESELTNEMILASDIILCGKNYTREKYNKKIRHDALHIDSDIPTYGEKVICRKNNRMIEVDNINLANGLVGTVVNQPGVHSFDGKTFMIDFKPDLLNSYFTNIACDYQYFIANTEQKKVLKNRRYGCGEKFDWGYCNTVHTAQGSQYANGIYIEEYLSKDIQPNLNYTAITRFSNSIIYVKKNRKYF